MIRRGSTYVDESCRNLFQNNFIEQDTLPAGWYRATLHAPRPRSTARKPVVGRRKQIPIRPIRQEMKSRVITHAARELSSFSASRHEGDVCQRRWQQLAPLPQKFHNTPTKYIRGNCFRNVRNVRSSANCELMKLISRSLQSSTRTGISC